MDHFVFADIDSAVESLATAIATHPRDWSLDHRDAWIYGIVIGWDAPALQELTAMHHWDAATVARMKRFYRDLHPPTPQTIKALMRAAQSEDRQ